MAVYHVNGPNGEVYEVTAPDDATQAQVVAFAQQQHAKTAPPAAPKPQGYDQAVQRLKQRDAQAAAVDQKFGGGFGSDFLRQVARNTGAFDEVAGGMNYLTQGAENIFRQATGKPIEIPAATAAQAATDYERQGQQQYAQQHPTANAFATAATVAASGRPTGAAALRNPFAAGAAVAAQNAPFAVARQQGNLKQRLPGAAKETAVAFGTGAALTGAANVLGDAAARAAANPSAARQLSQQGVDLTPGQMAGGAIQRAEDMGTSLPITGAAINGARNRGVESFNRATLNQTLAPIGETLPNGVNVGREGLQVATQRISDAYNRALHGVTVTPDAQFANDIAAIHVPPSLQGDFDAIRQNALSHMGASTDGQTWKAVDSQLNAFYRAADNASQQNPVQRFLRDAIGQMQDAHMGLLERTSTAAADGVRAADQATANLVRVRHASQNAATARRAGVFTPAELNRAALSTDTSSGNRAYGTGQATMQNLTEPAMQVLPSQMADSGTAGRLMGAGAIYGGASATLGPHVGVGAVATDAALSTLYSRPVQAMLNAIYRATTPGQARAALSALSAAAARDPAVVPAYTEALHRLGLGPGASGGQPVPQQSLPAPTTR